MDALELDAVEGEVDAEEGKDSDPPPHPDRISAAIYNIAIRIFNVFRIDQLLETLLESSAIFFILLGD